MTAPLVRILTRVGWVLCLRSQEAEIKVQAEEGSYLQALERILFTVIQIVGCQSVVEMGCLLG